MPPSNDDPCVRTAVAIRRFFDRHRQALRTAWDLAPNATVAMTAVSMAAILHDMGR